MLAASAPTPPPPVRTDTRAIEPDEQWKAELHKRIEDDLRNMVQEAQIVRDTILNSRPSESSRELALSNYEKSMNDIRTLAQEEFTRELRIELSERRWALDVVSSHSPDVARQQQRVLDSIRKTDEDHTTTSPSGASHSPPQQGDGEHGFDGSPEEGYESAGLGDEGGESGESRETSEEDDEDEEEGEYWDEENAAPRQSRPPPRPNVPLTRPLQSKSPVSRRNTPSGQGSNFHATEDKEDKDAYDSHGHSVQRHPYSLGGAPRRQTSGSQSSLWRPVPRAPEPSSMPRTTTFSHTIGQKYNTGPAQFPSRVSVNSTGSTSNGAGLHRAGSLNSEQYRSSSVAPHSGAERPPTQNRDRIASNIASRERQTSASASPHEKPSPPSYPTVSPRAIPGARPPPLDDAVRFPTSARPGSRMMYSLQRSPEDMRPGVVIPRGPPTPDDGPRGTSWSSLNSRRSLGDFNLHRRHNSKGDRLPPVDGDLSDASDDAVGQLDDRHSIRSIRSVHSMRSIDLEQRAAWLEAEAKRKEEEATRKEEEASKKEDEARRLEEKARQSLEEAKRLEAGPRQAEASAKMREAAAQNKEAEAKRKEAEAKKREAESQKREAEAQRKEEQARQMEREARRKEEQARRKEEEAQRKEDEARKREEEVRRKEDDARKREDDARRREEDARQREMVARQKEEDVVGQLNVRQSMHSLCDIRSVRSLGSVDLEERALWIEAEAKRMEEEARKKEDEARRLEEKARQSLEEAKRLEAGARQAEASAKMREAAAQNKEAEYKCKEAEVKKREVESQKREAEAQRKEEQARQMEREARRKEEQARRKEDEVRKREEEVLRKEDDARKREDDTRRRQEDARQWEMVARQEEDVVGQFDVRQSMHSFCDIRSVRSLGSVDLEERALWVEAEAKRMEEEASKKEDEARRLEEKARRSLEEAKRLEAGARQAEASARMREAAAKNKETEAKRKEAEAKKREVESQKREAEAQRKEEQVRQMEREARRKEDEVRKREEEVRRKEGRAQARG